MNRGGKRPLFFETGADHDPVRSETDLGVGENDAVHVRLYGVVFKSKDA
jgi:hypothetical protein